VANSIWQRIEHKIWEVDQEIGDAETDNIDPVLVKGDNIPLVYASAFGLPTTPIPTFVVSERFVKAMLSRLAPDEHLALLRRAIAQAITNEVLDIRDDDGGCTCEEHLAERAAEDD
jgi:hypothetical protein